MISINIQLEVWRILCKIPLWSNLINLSAKICAIVDVPESGNDLANVNSILLMRDRAETLPKGKLE